MTDEDFIAQAADLARESVRNGWGGPFGAVVVQGGAVIATGQNLVLRTGDPTAHAEMVAIRNASAALWPAPVQPDPDADVPGRIRMLAGCVLYSSSFPCPMCLSAISWARIAGLVYACGVADAASIGFDDEFQYREFALPEAERALPIRQAGRDLAWPAMQEWAQSSQRQLY
jgi:tRNA(Arg) A34 adenosine deaminase TadA